MALINLGFKEDEAMPAAKADMEKRGGGYAERSHVVRMAKLAKSFTFDDKGLLVFKSK